MEVNPQIFREYDIRGVFGKDLTEEVAEVIGKAYGTYLSSFGISKITLGRDCRISSDPLKEAILGGLLSTGLSVIDLGVVATPVFYFSLFHLDVNGGVMITGSHNPPEFNGFKMCLGKTTIFGKEIKKIEEIIKKGDFKKGDGKVSTYDISDPYKTYLKENVKLKRSVKVVIDPGNGTAGVFAYPIMKDIGCDVLCINCEMDGNFPNHHPDPTVLDNLKDLKEAVLKNGAELGIGYDGDADRIGVIDERGEVIWGDQLMIIFSRDILEKNAQATIIAEVKSSMNLFEEIKKCGGKPIMWKTGHSLIKQKMKEEGALLAGEMSGHIFFADRYFGFDDAIYASLRLLEIVSKQNKKVSEMLKDVPKTYSTPEIRVDCPDEAKFEVVERIKEKLEGKYEMICVDGVRVVFNDGWGLIRASNTQPVLVLRFEAKSEKRLLEIRKFLEEKLLEVKNELRLR